MKFWTLYGNFGFLHAYHYMRNDTRIHSSINEFSCYMHSNIRKMKRAAVVSERTMGEASEETLRILLEVLRILTRASSWTPASALLSGGEKNGNLEMMPGRFFFYANCQIHLMFLLICTYIHMRIL
jgi:hypothetical protein